jgi:hypothetical protein
MMEVEENEGAGNIKYTEPPTSGGLLQNLV